MKYLRDMLGRGEGGHKCPPPLLRNSVSIERDLVGQLRLLRNGGETRLVAAPPSVSRLLFTLAYAAYVFAAGWSATTFLGLGGLSKGLICGVLQGAAALLFAVKLLTQHYTLKQLAILVVAGFVAMMTALVAHDFGAVWIFVLVAASQGIELQHVARVTCLATLAVIVLAALGMFAGLCPAVFAQRGNTGPIRYSMGFSHTNLFANSVAVAGVAWFVSRVPRARLIDLGVLALSAAIIFLVTNSRTMTLAVLILLVIATVYVIGHRAPAPMLAISLFCLAALTSLGIMVLYPDFSTGTSMELDYLLSYRPYYFHSYFKALGISVFGGDVVAAHVWPVGASRTGLMLDNSYVSLLLGKGGFVFAGICAGTVLCALRARRDSRYLPFLFALSFFAVAGFAENIANSVAMNFSLVCMGYLLYGVPSSACLQGSSKEPLGSSAVPEEVCA